MDDIKPSNTSDTDTDSPLPKPGGGQVMDIQTSKPFSPGVSAPVLPESNDQDTESPYSAAETENTDTEPKTDTVAEAPAQAVPDAEADEASDSIPADIEASSLSESETPAEPSADTPADPAPGTSINVASAQDISPSEPAADPPSDTSAPESSTTSPLAIPPAPAAPKKNGKPILVVMVALIVAIALAGLVVYTFLKKKDTLGTNKTVNSSAAQTAAKPLASPADVDSTNKEIETSLSKVNDSTDFASTDLSDKSLGL